MRSSLMPPRRQAGRICDACRQHHQLHRHQQRRTLTSAPFFLASTQSSSARAPSSSSRPSAARRPCAPPSPLLTRSIGHSRTLRNPGSSSSGVAEGKEGGGQGEEKPLPTKASRVPVTHYDLFPQTLPKGPPPAGPFHVDVRALRREYLALQATAHPDRHPGALKARAEAQSARVNEAFATLANPFRRAVYVLDLKRQEHEEREQQLEKNNGETTAPAPQPPHHDDETAKLDDPELLMLVLEAREQVEEAASEEELAPLARDNDERIRLSEEALEAAFARDDLAAAGREVVRLRYWVNIKESIDNWERGKPVVLEH